MAGDVIRDNTFGKWEMVEALGVLKILGVCPIEKNTLISS